MQFGFFVQSSPVFPGPPLATELSLDVMAVLEETEEDVDDGELGDIELVLLLAGDVTYPCKSPKRRILVRFRIKKNTTTAMPRSAKKCEFFIHAHIEADRFSPRNLVHHKAFCLQ